MTACVLNEELYPVNQHTPVMWDEGQSPSLGPGYEDAEEKERKLRDELLDSIARNLGSQVIDALNDPEVIEIMLNPDGRLWVEKFSEPMRVVGVIDPGQAVLAVKFIGSRLGKDVGADQPKISGELPIDSSRFEAVLPPVTAGPIFAIRKKASKVFTFEEYLAAGNLSPEARDILEEAVIQRKNILVVGGTGSGKTTFVNAIIEAIARLTPEHRLVIIEDTVELQPKSENCVQMCAKKGLISMEDLLVSSLRLRPDRILVGEVRDSAAQTLINAWNTGHEGGVATVHANSAAEGLYRIEELITMGNQKPIRTAIARTVDYVVFMRKQTGIRRLTEIIAVGYDRERKDYEFSPIYIYKSAGKAQK